MSEKSAVYETSTIAEMTNGIILANYEKILQVQETYQSEAESYIQRKIHSILRPTLWWPVYSG